MVRDMNVDEAIAWVRRNVWRPDAQTSYSAAQTLADEVTRLRKAQKPRDMSDVPGHGQLFYIALLARQAEGHNVIIDRAGWLPLPEDPE